MIKAGVVHTIAATAVDFSITAPVIRGQRTTPQTLRSSAKAADGAALLPS